MGSHFFAYLGRMKLIRRWSLMRNTVPENIQEHSLQVAMIAHNIALCGNKYYGRAYDPERIALLALFHDVGEVIVGDLPTPVKYFNPDIKSGYQTVENIAKERLLAMLPGDFQADYRAIFFDAPPEMVRIIKAADKIAAYIKCVEEGVAGNGEFRKAEKSLQEEISKFDDLPEVGYFMHEFMPSFGLTLDEMNG